MMLHPTVHVCCPLDNTNVTHLALIHYLLSRQTYFGPSKVQARRYKTFCSSIKYFCHFFFQLRQMQERLARMQAEIEARKPAVQQNGEIKSHDL